MPYIPDSGGIARDHSDSVGKASKDAAARNVWPTARQVAMGACLYGESLRDDVSIWTRKLRAAEACEPVLALAELFVLTGDPGLLGKLPAARSDGGMDADDDLRCLVYALASGIVPEWLDGIRAATGRAPLALAWTHGVGFVGLHDWTRAAQERRVACGLAEMALMAGDAAFDVLDVEIARGVPSEKHFVALLDRLVAEARHRAVDLPAALSGEKPPPKVADLPKADDLDRGADPEATPTSAVPPTKVVIRAAARPASASKELFKACESIVGKALPLCAMPDQAFSSLVAEWPHAASVVRRILGRQRLGQTIRLRPTLLVGRPGTGKTALAVAIGRRLGLEPAVYPCAGAADNSFGGTPSRWASAGLSVPGEAIVRHGVANPLVVLDEIEKAGTSRNHGRLEDCLLPMLEEHTARAYLEVGLGTTMDLSAVNYVATANSLVLSPPLLDRFDVIEMPDPGPQHVGTLARRIVEDLARERDEEGFPRPLAPDELEILGKAWGGGSLRKLRRLVGVLVESREALEARQ